MNRFLLVAVGLMVLASAAPGKRIAAPPNPVQRALNAEVVIAGKITAIEKETVEAKPNPGSPPVAHRIAIVKIDDALVGAGNLTHLKVGFIPTAPNVPRPRGLPAIALKEGQQGLFFLTKHPSGGFYHYNWMSSPVLAEGEANKSAIASVHKALAAVADPSKALKAEKAEDRAFAAAVLLTRYRTPAPGEGDVTQEKVSLEESRLILKALAEADWTKYDANAPQPVQAFYSLGLNQSNQWTPPKPGKARQNYNAELQKAFAGWIEGPGKDFQITRLVRKKK